MWISDTSVKRPVLATVVNLLLVVFGLAALATISIREYPDIDPPVVSVQTNYTGASASVVETQITQIIEDQIAGLEGIHTITSASRDGRSAINVEFELSRDIDAAANDVRDRVSRVLDNLPDQVDAPEVTKADADAQPVLWLVLTSDRMDRLQLTDYADRYLVDRFASIDGVSQVRFGGDRRYAMRIWLDREGLAARQLTVQDVENALSSENVERPAGRIESSEREFTLRTVRPYRTAADFEQLVITTGPDGFPVRMRDVARVELGSENPRGEFRANGRTALGIGVVKTSNANTLAVAAAARAVALQLAADLPAGMQLEVNYDSSEFIEAALHEVQLTLGYAALFVILVIFVFLGSVRATLIPAVTVPISLIASFIFLQAFGFSINILTLLALVLAIGLVVDDAIVVVENIHRRLELGEPPLLAAYRGTREVGFAIVATTAVLMAVFAPLAFLEGNVGRLFREFALALATAVGCSGITALTLAPVLSVWLLRSHQSQNGLLARVDRAFDRLAGAYRRRLDRLSHQRAFAVLLLLALFGAMAALFVFIPKEFTPPEDRGQFQVNVTAPEGASLAYTQRVLEQLEAPLARQLGKGEIERTLVRLPGFGGGDEVNTGLVTVSLVPWTERERSSHQIGDEVQQAASDISAARVIVQQRGGIGSRGAQPVQIAIGGASYEELAGWRDRILARVARENPRLLRLDNDYRETKPQIELRIDVNRAADLGVSVLDVSQSIETFFGERRVTRFQDRGEEYEVILQAPAEARQDPGALREVYVRSQGGALVPLSNLVTSAEKASASSYNRVNRLRAITVSANLAPGYTLGEALDYMERVIQEETQNRAVITYRGESREYKDSSAALYLTFALALVIVYLLLAAQFESFVHPLVILTTVPLAVFGALAGMMLLGMTLNIYSQIGIVMLVGLVAKNGILIVEFANQRRDQGVAFHDALIEAASVRLRPILMTSIATIAGAVPLIFASGAGYEARRILGVVIFFGVAFSTLLTLFIVPAFYELLCRRTGSPGRHAQTLEAQEHALPESGSEVS